MPRKGKAVKFEGKDIKLEGKNSKIKKCKEITSKEMPQNS